MPDYCKVLKCFIPEHTLRMHCQTVVCLILGIISLSKVTAIRVCHGAVWVEVNEMRDQESAITCDGFTAHDNLTWRVFGDKVTDVNLTCKNLTLPCMSANSDTDIKVKEVKETFSQLIIVGSDRTRSWNHVICTADSQTTSCGINVISPARLSDCKVQIFTINKTVTGSCSFDGAYSSNDTYIGTWHRNDSRQCTVYNGIIKRTEQKISNKTYYNGTCEFNSSLPEDAGYEGNLYSVDFFPGPGRHTVLTVVMTTTYPLQTASSNPTITMQSDSTKDVKTENPSDGNALPLGAIIGGSVAGVVAITFVIILVIVCKKRKKKQQPRNVRSDDGHSNPAFENGEELESPLQTRPSGVALRIPFNTTNAAVRNQENVAYASNINMAEHATDVGYSSLSFGGDGYMTLADSGIAAAAPRASRYGPQLTTVEADLYVAVDRDNSNNASLQISDSQKISSPTGGDVYAVVDKSKSKNSNSSPSSNLAGEGTEDGSNAYAVVDKSHRGRDAPAVFLPPNSNISTGQMDIGTDLYAQVDKSFRVVHFLPLLESSGRKDDHYTEIQPVSASTTSKPNIKPKPFATSAQLAFKPTPPRKPCGTGEQGSALGVTGHSHPDQSTKQKTSNGYEEVDIKTEQPARTDLEDDGTYNVLHHNQRQPQTPDVAVQYSHLGDL